MDLDTDDREIVILHHMNWKAVGQLEDLPFGHVHGRRGAHRRHNTSVQAHRNVLFRPVAADAHGSTAAAAATTARSAHRTPGQPGHQRQPDHRSDKVLMYANATPVCTPVGSDPVHSTTTHSHSLPARPCHYPGRPALFPARPALRFHAGRRRGRLRVRSPSDSARTPSHSPQ